MRKITLRQRIVLAIILLLLLLVLNLLYPELAGERPCQLINHNAYDQSAAECD